MIDRPLVPAEDPDTFCRRGCYWDCEHRAEEQRERFAFVLTEEPIGERLFQQAQLRGRPAGRFARFGTDRLLARIRVIADSVGFPRDIVKEATVWAQSGNWRIEEAAQAILNDWMVQQTNDLIGKVRPYGARP